MKLNKHHTQTLEAQNYIIYVILVLMSPQISVFCSMSNRFIELQCIWDKGTKKKKKTPKMAFNT